MRTNTPTSSSSSPPFLPSSISAFRPSSTRLAVTVEVVTDDDLSSSLRRGRGREGRQAGGGEWRKVDDEVEVLFPEAFAQPKGIIHFVGGAVVGAFPRAAYGPLLERLARQVGKEARKGRREGRREVRIECTCLFLLIMLCSGSYFYDGDATNEA